MISIDEALFAPENLNKYKQISDGEKCTVDKKFSTPVVITRTPVILTANVPPWRTNASEKTPLMNRTHYIMTTECPWLKDIVKDFNPIAYWAFYQATLHPGVDCDHFYTAAEATVQQFRSGNKRSRRFRIVVVRSVYGVQCTCDDKMRLVSNASRCVSCDFKVGVNWKIYYQSTIVLDTVNWSPVGYTILWHDYVSG